MADLILSDKEQTLLDFIKEKGEVTIKQIEEGLSVSHTGALGRLLNKELIVSDKKRNSTSQLLGGDSNYNKYSHKMVKYYKIKEV